MIEVSIPPPHQKLSILPLPAFHRKLITFCKIKPHVVDVNYLGPYLGDKDMSNRLIVSVAHFSLNLLLAILS